MKNLAPMDLKSERMVTVRGEVFRMQAAKQAVARLFDDDREYLLYPGQSIKLGRASENDIVLIDPKVSRSHAALEWNGTGFTLRDLGSVNGTFVNEQRLIEANRLLR